jgi:hypothetical protein
VLTAALPLLILFATPADSPGETVHLGELTEAAPRVLVLDPAGSLPEDKRRAVGSLVADVLDARDDMEVVTSADVEKLIALESERQTAGCDEASCLSEIAGALGARLVVFGDITQLDESYAISLSLFDSEEARSVARVTGEAAGETQLPAVVRNLARELLAEREGRDATPDLEPVPEVVRGPAPMALAWTLGAVGIGATVALGGVVYDMFSPTSADRSLDVLDAVGPAIVGTGVGVAVVGLVFNPFAGAGDE